MKNEKLLEAMGYLDEQFLAENLNHSPAEQKTIRFFGLRNLRNLVAAVLVVALLGCAVLANTVPAAPQPDWEPYGEADTVIDYLFGTHRYSANEGMIRIKEKYVWVGDKETGKDEKVEVRIPITSSASREPVSEELAAMVRPYFIPVGKTITDPTGTMTLEVMTYFYEPETGCGVAYVRLSDPTGEFGGYVLDPPLVDAGTENDEDIPKGIGAYLEMYEKLWGRKYSQWSHSGLRLVEAASDEYNWTFAASFWTSEDVVDMSIGFRTKLDIDYPQYRIKLDLERQPTMETLSFHNGSLRETVIISPVSMRIDGSDSVNEWSEVSNVVIHFRDGSSYVVKDDENCVYGWAATSGYMIYDNGRLSSYTGRVGGRLISYLFSNIIDIHQVQYIHVDGYNYVLTNP